MNNLLTFYKPTHRQKIQGELPPHSRLYCIPDYYLKVATLVALTVLLGSIPFKHNKGIVYAAETLLALVFVSDLYCFKKSHLFFQTIKTNPFTWIISLYSATVLFSVFFSYNPYYSFKQFTYEIIINVVLFYLIIYLMVRKYITLHMTLNILIYTNVIFMLIYFSQGIQWYLFPNQPFMSTINSSIKIHDIFDVFFILTRCSNLFSYKAPSTYSLFFIALGFTTLLSSKLNIQTLKIILLSSFNLIMVIFSMLKAPVIAICLTSILACFLPFKRKLQFLITGLTLLSILILIVLFSPISNKFMRGENLSAVIHGKYKESGSFGSRLHGYPLYLKQLLKHPFIGVGIGRRNIKQALPILVRKSGLPHGHNTIINTAIQQGIQSALALIIFIFLKFKKGIFFLEKTNICELPAYIYVSSYIIWLCMFWIRSSFDDMFRHSISTFYWILAAFYTFCIMQQVAKKQSDKI